MSKVTTIRGIGLTEEEARQLVDAQFRENAKRRGQICEWPVIGGHYVSGGDPVTTKRRELPVRALRAQDWFYRNGPSDLGPLPLIQNNREDLKRTGRLLDYIFALFARSVDGADFYIEDHPPFANYAAGVLWEGGLFHSADQLAELKRRFPPRELRGLGPGFCWTPPKPRTKARKRPPRH